MLTMSSQLQNGAAAKAAKLIQPDDCTSVHKGLTLSGRGLWRRRGSWAIVHWPDKSLVLLKDGKLMLLAKDVARQVKVPRTILEQVFTIHKQTRWWMKDPGYRIIPDAEAVLYDREAYPGSLSAETQEYLKSLTRLSPFGEAGLLEFVLDNAAELREAVPV